MSKVMTFSRVYPSYHPKAGQDTYFVEKIWRSLGLNGDNLFKFLPYVEAYNDLTSDTSTDQLIDFETLAPKHHTIRAGHRWKEGDWFSPRVWSGKPRHSKQITFAPDIKVKKVWPFQIIRVLDGMLSSYQMIVEGKELPLFGPVEDVFYLAKNDGLEYNDFCDWFKMDTAKKDIHFDGQIICWNENIEY